MESTDLRWEGPPAEEGRRRDWGEEAEALRSRPGEWAILAVKTSRAAASNFVRSIKVGNTRAFRPAGAFESVERQVGGEFRVYVRYVGPS